MAEKIVVPELGTPISTLLFHVIEIFSLRTCPPYIYMFSRPPEEKKKDCLMITVFKNLKVDSFTLTERMQIILPVQLCPSPWYPGLQEQLNDPWVLLHQAFS